MTSSLTNCRFLTALPVFNEATTVGSVLDEVSQYCDEILVVDDGSTDGTSELLAQRTDVLRIAHPVNRGYGAALISAFKYARNNGYNVLVTIDCDGQHEPQRIQEFVRQSINTGADIISGSRYLKSFGEDSPPPEQRRLINQQVTRILNDRLGLGLTDAFCGFKAYRVDAIKKLALTETGYAMPLELWVQAACCGLSVVEVAVPRIYLDESRSFGDRLDDPNTRLKYYYEVLNSENDPDSQQLNQRATIPTRKLRAPRHHGETLQNPSLTELNLAWEPDRVSSLANAVVGSTRLDLLQQLGRKEIIELATRYTQSYLDINLADQQTTRLIMAGHQPELFHPGVWYKNFVLSKLAAHLQAIAINLVVDNDLCRNEAVRYPTLNGSRVSVGSIPVDQPGLTVPFESRPIKDFDFFQSFATRAAISIAKLVDSPIVHQLWPLVVDSAENTGNQTKPRLGAAIAAGRHRLEHEFGLRTLEVPVSWISESESFAIFVESILLNLEKFQLDYNESLTGFRTANRIRSRSHPVPGLETSGAWQESPFWVWQTERPNRQRLFSKLVDDRIVLSDRHGWQTEIELSRFRQQFRELNNKGIAIRPRALMTTMFSRLVLSDLFIHGIGGAKYDQLTDLIACRFFKCQLPEYLTLSATLKLPSDFEMVDRKDLSRLNQTIRDFKFHPETHIDNPASDAIELINQKRNWTTGEYHNLRSQTKHQSINELNRKLGTYLEPEVEQLRIHRDHVLKNLRASEILGSRDYSFCLFPVGLIKELKKLSDFTN